MKKSPRSRDRTPTQPEDERGRAERERERERERICGGLCPHLLAIAKLLASSAAYEDRFGGSLPSPVRGVNHHRCCCLNLFFHSRCLSRAFALGLQSAWESLEAWEKSLDCVCHVAGRGAVGAAARRRRRRTTTTTKTIIIITTTAIIATTEVEQQALLFVVVLGVVEPAFVVVVVVLLGAAIYSHVEPLGERHQLLHVDGYGYGWHGDCGVSW